MILNAKKREKADAKLNVSSVNDHIGSELQ